MSKDDGIRSHNGSYDMRRLLLVLYAVFVGVPLLLLTILVGIYYDLCKKMGESE